MKRIGQAADQTVRGSHWEFTDTLANWRASPTWTAIESHLYGDGPLPASRSLWSYLALFAYAWNRGKGRNSKRLSSSARPVLRPSRPIRTNRAILSDPISWVSMVTSEETSDERLSSVVMRLSFPSNRPGR